MKVEADVVEAVRQTRSASVIVSLTPPAGYGEEGADIEAMKPAIARLQDEVLAALDPADYQSRIRFDALPALALTILAERALVALERHPLVIAVRLDLGGVG